MLTCCTEQIIVMQIDSSLFWLGHTCVPSNSSELCAWLQAGGRCSWWTASCGNEALNSRAKTTGMQVEAGRIPRAVI